MTYKNKKLRNCAFTVAAVAALMFFSAADASADYYNLGVLKSTNVLSGATVTAINGFNVTSSIPAGGAVSIQFSQDNVNFYSSTGTIWAWDACSNGTTNINLSGLGWSGGLLFYKLKLETTDAAATPSVTDIQVDYDGTEVPPDSGIRYPNEGTLVSTDLLAGLGGSLNFFNGTEAFGYNITSLPAGTAVYAQFSQDGANFYNSTGTQWGWDSLSSGDHLEAGAALDLSGLHWSGDSFYYKLKLTSIDLEQTPVVSEVNLLRKATQANSPQTNLLNDDSLVGYWSFNGPDMDWASTTAEALDRSGNSNNGNVVNFGKEAVTPGISGQGLRFDGSNDYVNAGHSSSLDLADAVTISTWVKFDSFSATQNYIVSKRTQWNTASGYYLIYDAPTVHGIEVRGRTSNYARAVNLGLVAGTWYHIVGILTDNGSGNAVYINGVNRTTSTAVTETLESNSLDVIVGATSPPAYYFDGLMDEVRVYNRALSEEEIGQLYRAGARTMKIDPTKGYKTMIGN